MLHHRAELQTVVLEDINSRLQALRRLLSENVVDVTKAHEILRDLVRMFEDLAANAQAFMAGVARSLELQQADATAIVAYKRRLIEYLERFMGDLIRRSDAIARLLHELSGPIDAALGLGCTDAAAVRHLLSAARLERPRPESVEVGALAQFERPPPTLGAYDQLLTPAASGPALGVPR